MMTRKLQLLSTFVRLALMLVLLAVALGVAPVSVAWVAPPTSPEPVLSASALRLGSGQAALSVDSAEGPA